MLSVTNDSELFLLGPETVPILKPLSLLLKSHASIVCRKISLHKTRDSTGMECLVAHLLYCKHGTTTCTIVRFGSARLSDAHCAYYSMQHRSIEKKRGKTDIPLFIPNYKNRRTVSNGSYDRTRHNGLAVILLIMHPFISISICVYSPCATKWCKLCSGRRYGICLDRTLDIPK